MSRKPKAPKAPPPAPDPNAKAMQEAQAEQARLNSRRRGLTSTILTSATTFKDTLGG